MPRYKAKWTELIYWESEIEANNEQEALENTDLINENAEQIKTIETSDIELEEVKKNVY